MAKGEMTPEIKVLRDMEKCVSCPVCHRLCSNDAHLYDRETGVVSSKDSRCMGCHFCESLCPMGSLVIRRNPSKNKLNALGSGRALEDIARQAIAGGILLTGMGSDRPFPVFPHLLSILFDTAPQFNYSRK